MQIFFLRPSCRYLLHAVLYLLCFFPCLLKPAVSAEEKTTGDKEPIVITSETLTVDNKIHTALFEGSVFAKTEDMSLYSDKMFVRYAEDTGKVRQIDAEGRVRLIKKEKVITSNNANYFAHDKKVVFTGEPKAIEEGSIVTGTKITYFMDTDRSIVENSKVFLDNKGSR